MPFSNKFSTDIADLIVSDTAISSLASADRYVALHDSDPSPECTNGELAGDGYARTLVSMAVSDVAAGKQITNDAIVVFPVATGTKGGQVTHFSVWDSSSGGDAVGWGVLTAPANWVDGQSLSLAVNALILTVVDDI